LSVGAREWSGRADPGSRRLGAANLWFIDEPFYPRAIPIPGRLNNLNETRQAEQHNLNEIRLGDFSRLLFVWCLFVVEQNASSEFEEKENGILFFSTGSESCQHIAAHGISTASFCSPVS
jgi:hypothetical protein